MAHRVYVNDFVQGFSSFREIPERVKDAEGLRGEFVVLRPLSQGLGEYQNA